MVADSADVSPLTVSTAYNAKYGAIGAVGQKIFVEVIEINTATGQKGRSFQTSTVIVA